MTGHRGTTVTGYMAWLSSSTCDGSVVLNFHRDCRFIDTFARGNCTLEIGVESHDQLYRNPFLGPLRPDESKADVRTQPETPEDAR
jgi:hypothetical protein